MKCFRKVSGMLGIWTFLGVKIMWSVQKNGELGCLADLENRHGDHFFFNLTLNKSQFSKNFIQCSFFEVCFLIYENFVVLIQLIINVIMLAIY